MFYTLDFWKNEFAAKQDLKPVSAKTEYFGKKGSDSYWGSRIMEREFKDCFQSLAPRFIHRF